MSEPLSLQGHAGHETAGLARRRSSVRFGGSGSDPNEAVPLGRKEAMLELFLALDLNGDGTVSAHDLAQVIQASRRMGGSKRHMKGVMKLDASMKQVVETYKRLGVKTGYALKSGSIEFLVDGEGCPALERPGFITFFHELTQADTDDEFAEYNDWLLNAVSEAYESTQGTRHKKLIWEMFRMLDVNRNGFVELDEIEVLLKDPAGQERHRDKKSLTKWRHKLQQLQNEEAQAQAVQEDQGDAAEIRPPGSMSLSDFQEFIEEFTDNNQTKIETLLASVTEQTKQQHRKYIEDKKVRRIMEALLDDLLRDQPADVLGGIIQSCEKLRETGTGPMLERRLSRRASKINE